MGGPGGGGGGGAGRGGGGRRRGEQSRSAAATATSNGNRRDQQQVDGGRQQDVPVSPLLRLSMSGQNGAEASTSMASSSTLKAVAEEGEITGSEAKSDGNGMDASASPAKRQKMEDGSSATISANSSSLLICHPTTSTDHDKNTTKRGSTKVLVRLDEPDWMARQPPHLRRLVRAAADRSTTLLLMPGGMARRKENTTTYSPKQDVIRWRIEWRFHLQMPSKAKEGGKIAATEETAQSSSGCANTARADATPMPHTDPSPAVVTISVDGIPESTSLAEVLSAQLDVNPEGKNRAARSRLRPLASLPRQSLRILTKLLPCPASNPLYIELRSDQSLAEALKGLTVVEFPVLEVVREEELGLFRRKIEML